jgi:hypothetical protein
MDAIKLHVDVGINFVINVGIIGVKIIVAQITEDRLSLLKMLWDLLKDFGRVVMLFSGKRLQTYLKYSLKWSYLLELSIWLFL